MLKVKADFDLNAIRKEIEQQVREYEQHVFHAYQDAATQWMERAKAKTKAQGSFGNITYRLRSSIGYIIFKDGVEVDIAFEAEESGFDGVEEGKEYAREIGQQHPTGYALVCVAGMEYAAAVETKGFDVITGSSLYIEQDLAELLAA